jgi:hypothetical protein
VPSPHIRARRSRKTDQAITIGESPARPLRMHCPPGSGLLVELAVTVHDGTAFVFASQHPTGTTAAEPADRAACRKPPTGPRTPITPPSWCTT